jgi:lipoate---protein ligase
MTYIKCDSENANFNFALEKYAMDELAVSDGYFMFWRTTPTLMVGRYQNTLAEINMPFAKANHINIVRRITGGGTIYTDPNGWQFSFIVKNRGTQQIDFDSYTKPILDALHTLGVPAQASGRNDLVIDGKKFSGNAQYNRKNLTLHHGSLLFDTNLENLVRALTPDDEKLISKGIQSVRQRVTNIAEHLGNSITTLEFRDVMLGVLLENMDTYELNSLDLKRVDEIKQAQFDTWAWNFGSNPKFNISKENRFAGGRLSVQSFVENGKIADIRFYGDFFAKEGLDTLLTKLNGCLYKEDDIKKVLEENNAENYFYNITLEELLSCIV